LRIVRTRGERERGQALAELLLEAFDGLREAPHALVELVVGHAVVFVRLVENRIIHGALREVHRGRRRRIELARQSTPGGGFAHAVNRTFDGFLRLTGEDIDGANAVTFGYDADDVLISAGGMTVTRSMNALLTNTSVGSVADTFGYNAYGEVVSHGVSGASYSATYTRDAAGRVDTKTETIGGTTLATHYTYNAAGHLWQVFENGAPAATREYAYTPNGNRDGGIYDAQDRLLSYGGATYTYGKNGELATKSSGGILEKTYDYDAFGNLRSVTPAAGPTITYVIDGLDRRVGKKLGGTLSQGFLYAGQRIIAELDGSGAIVSRFVYATGGHSPDVMVRGGTTYRIIKDDLGSPRLVVNASSGAIAQRLEYDEWGNTTESGTIGFQPFGFAGGLWDRDTNLIRFGARDYDPTTGRWTSKDLSRFGGGLNFYAYANNDPINFIDPDGRFPLPPNPSGLGPGWTRDFTNLNPNGEKWIHKSGDWLEYHKGGCSSHRDAAARCLRGGLCGLRAITFARTVTSA
jgi:RHS repeat-associated protein